MPKTDLAIASTPMAPGGIDDTMPIAQQALSFFRAQGFAINNGVAGRLSGKKLLLSLSTPVVAIHSDCRNGVWIQTADNLTYIDDFFHAFL